VTSPYRNETDALLERKAALEKEIADLRAQASHIETLRARQAELDRELAGVSAKLGAAAGARRALPMLDQVRVASPCHARWEEMVGDAAVRFCASCQKSVYNLSAMSREQAEALLQARVGGELCVRFYQRADGSVMTDDCPVGVKRKRRRKAALAIGGAGAMAYGAMSALTNRPCMMGAREAHLQGEVAMPQVVGTAPIPVTPPPVDTANADDSRPHAMGVTAVPVDPRPAVVGRRVHVTK
jgi:hypothetical protein